MPHHTTTDARTGGESPPPDYETPPNLFAGSRVTFSATSPQQSALSAPSAPSGPFGNPFSAQGRKKSRGGSMTFKQKINVVTGKPLNENHTVIGMVVDRSGSMSSMRNEVHGGCNAYLDEQRKNDEEDKGTSSVIFTRFDSYVEVLLDGVNLHNVQPITAADVEPRGSTALYDAIGTTLVRTAEYVNKLDYMPSVVIFILTDGHENASQQWDKKSITEEIKRLQLDDFKWDFYFAAANQDGMAEGSKLGMAAAQCTTWNSASPSKVKSAFASSSAAYHRKKKCGIVGYSSWERAEMMEEE